jgi:hypothetical protein
MISSIEAYRYLRATMTECSQKAGWRSLLLRAYDDPPMVEPFTTPPTSLRHVHAKGGSEGHLQLAIRVEIVEAKAVVGDIAEQWR